MSCYTQSWKPIGTLSQTYHAVEVLYFILWRDLALRARGQQSGIFSRGAGPSNYTCQAHIDLLHGSQWSCVRGAVDPHRLGGLSKSCRSANKMNEAWPADDERLFAMSATYSSFPKHQKTGRPWQQNTMESTANTRDLRGAARSLSASISNDC